MKKLFMLACGICLTLALGLSAAAFEVVAYQPDGETPWAGLSFKVSYEPAGKQTYTTDAAGTCTVPDEREGQQALNIQYRDGDIGNMTLSLPSPLPATVALRDVYGYGSGENKSHFMARGTVLLPDGSPAAGAEVGSPRSSVTFPEGNLTDRNGKFRFRGSTDCTLTAHLDGYADVSVKWQTYEPNPVLRLEGTERTLRGSVKDAKGSPLPGAQVSAPGGAARAGADGSYTLDTWEQLSGRVTVGLSGYTFAPAYYELAAWSGDRTFDFVGTKDPDQPGPPDPPGPPTVGESARRSRSSRDEPYEDPNGFSDEEWDFWLKVAGEIEAAGEGGRVTASAERYERLPFPVLRALHARRDVTLRLERQGESVLLDYTLPAGRVFYPLEELMEHGGA
ncbi:carboxypeptidase-like regulatory domain-containing protein [Harryflintia acetispora]|uniref:Carboxypeptidase regulatory-like domain-containing protein n=1 Tax=Harryflintia acetispora TaxID=1849041 RepID=A0A9X8Y7U9_9FIRM|nr:carboxypeptidase-like regulatory domain-containing protein [Harryflintia acetispora]TCL42721.1 hypothetical protein EDD78_10832 [Harryflintia acetispora]